MTTTLHIINGDAFIEVLHNAGISGDILPWRDILHEGPVPSDAQPEQFADVRAQFIAQRGWGSYDIVRAMFAEREQMLSSIGSYSEVVLWFDPDLYDQLQLVQVLARMASAPAVAVSLVTTDRPGIDDSEEIRTLFAQRTAVTSEQFSLGQSAWQAVTSASPEGIADVLDGNTAALPYLRSALLRYVEEFPSQHSGLSRTEHTILRHAHEPVSLAELFAAVQASEEHPFLGDTTFASYVEQFTLATVPLLELQQEQELLESVRENEIRWAQRVQLTEVGKDVVEERTNNVHINGINRYVGGVYLHAQADKPIWYRDTDNTLVRKR